MGFGQGGSTGGQAESLPLPGSQVFSAGGNTSLPASQGRGRPRAAVFRALHPGLCTPRSLHGDCADTALPLPDPLKSTGQSRSALGQNVLISCFSSQAGTWPMWSPACALSALQGSRGCRWVSKTTVQLPALLLPLQPPHQLSCSLPENSLSYLSHLPHLTYLMLCISCFTANPVSRRTLRNFYLGTDK